jgi:hypothetical protein
MRQNFKYAASLSGIEAVDDEVVLEAYLIDTQKIYSMEKEYEHG